MQRLATTLAGEVGGRRLHKVVIGLPQQRWPATVAHPQQQSHAMLTLRLELSAEAVIVQKVRKRDPLFNSVRGPVRILKAAQEIRAPVCAAFGKVVQSPLRAW